MSLLYRNGTGHKNWHLYYLHKENKHNPDTLPHELVVIHINRQKITGEIGQPLRNEVSMIAMKQHLIDNKTIVPTAFGVIDWEAVGKKVQLLGNNIRYG